MSYTKGPWVKDGLHYLGRNGEKVVMSDGPAFGVSSQWPDADDNANLVRASPLLLEALEYCIDSLGDEFSLPKECIDEALYAISKAKGETNE